MEIVLALVLVVALVLVQLLRSNLPNEQGNPETTGPSPLSAYDDLYPGLDAALNNPRILLVVTLAQHQVQDCFRLQRIDVHLNNLSSGCPHTKTIGKLDLLSPHAYKHIAQKLCRVLYLPCFR